MVARIAGLTSQLVLVIAVGTMSLSAERLSDEVAPNNVPRHLPPPVTDADFPGTAIITPEKVELGRLLFFDKILSGNRNTSCATCHHPLAATGDGLSLPIGEGGRGLGVTRGDGQGLDAIHERVPRNSPPLFNLGALEYTVMFHDGRVFIDPLHPSGFQSPAGDRLPKGLDTVLAAQAMFPVTSAAEMAGQPNENRVADMADSGLLAGRGGVWELLADRLRAIPEYAALFAAAFSEVRSPSDITYVQAANAIAAFESFAFRSTTSPFDRFLAGDPSVLSRQAKRGLRLFYGQAGCADCHSGRFQTDHRFHALAMPPIGPGKGDGATGHDDFGHERVTGKPADRYRFRTPSLRNVALTGPWGHTGAFNTLRAVIEHHTDPVESLRNYDRAQAVLPPVPKLEPLDFLVYDNPVSRMGIEAACDLPTQRLTEAQIWDLIEFLYSLTDPASLDLRWTVPRSVPSGIPLAE